MNNLKQKSQSFYFIVLGLFMTVLLVTLASCGLIE